MGYAKTIVCLANSRKPPSGRCIAGREVTSTGFGDWIRPVSARPSQEISEEERWYEDGRDPKVLDIIEIKMTCPQPHLHQQENHVIDAVYYWAKRGRVSWHDLQPAAECVPVSTSATIPTVSRLRILGWSANASRRAMEKLSWMTLCSA